MFRGDETSQRIAGIQEIVLSQIQGAPTQKAVSKLNQFMLKLRSIGFVEGRTADGVRRRYLLIDGKSWDAACRILKPKNVPRTLAWEESHLIDFLKSHVKTESDQERTIGGDDAAMNDRA